VARVEGMSVRSVWAMAQRSFHVTPRALRTRCHEPWSGQHDARARCDGGWRPSRALDAMGGWGLALTSTDLTGPDQRTNPPTKASVRRAAPS
jgi:hypothetical protein